MKIVLCLESHRPTKLIAAAELCLHLNRDKILKLLFMAKLLVKQPFSLFSKVVTFQARFHILLKAYMLYIKLYLQKTAYKYICLKITYDQMFAYTVALMRYRLE